MNKKGHITISPEICKALHLSKGSIVSVTKLGNGILLIPKSSAGLGKGKSDGIPPAKKQGKITTKSWKKPGLRLVIPGVSMSKTIIDERRKARY